MRSWRLLAAERSRWGRLGASLSCRSGQGARVAGRFGLGGPVDVPADQSTPTRSPRLRPASTGTPAPHRRRPSGEAPPLPHHLQTSGVGWLVASVVLVVLSMVVFAGGLRGLAVAVTVADDAVV